MCVTIDRGLKWWMDLLTTFTQDSGLQVITAPPLIYIIYKSPQHPLSLLPVFCVFTSRFLPTASNSEYSSASRTQIVSSQAPLQNWTELSSKFPGYNISARTKYKTYFFIVMCVYFADVTYQRQLFTESPHSKTLYATALNNICNTTAITAHGRNRNKT
jgi:hypothetical protein